MNVWDLRVIFAIPRKIFKTLLFMDYRFLKCVCYKDKNDYLNNVI